MNTPLTITHLVQAMNVIKSIWRKCQYKIVLRFDTLPVEQDGSADKRDSGEYGKEEDGLDEGEPDEESECSDEASDQKDHVDEQPRNKKPSGGILDFII